MKKRTLPPILLIVLLWAGLTVFAWVKPADDISSSERRKLDQFPRFSLSSLQSGSFMEKFESAATDQFPLREMFRRLRAEFAANALGQLDSHEIISYDGYLEKLSGPIDESSLNHAAETLRSLHDAYFSDSEVYLAIVPEKAYYIPETAGYPFLDYDALIGRMQEALDFAQPIDLTGTLSLDSYYRTDSHWRQEHLAETAAVLAESLSVSLSGDYETELLTEDFLGVYAGQSARSVQPEPMYRLTNDLLEGCTVYNYETDRTTGLWDYEKLTARDPYDVYLSGAVSLLTIENPTAETDRELIVFRDSFGSSLIPLLAEGYRTITVIDTRYIQPELLPDYVDFRGQDVLLLYSTGLLNQSSALR